MNIDFVIAIEVNHELSFFVDMSYLSYQSLLELSFLDHISL